MNRFLRGTACAVLFMGALAGIASAATTLELVDPANGSTLFITDNGPVVCTGADCGTAVLPPTDTNFLPGVIGFSGIFDGFQISSSTGSSNSPNCSGLNGPNCLDTANINATNVSLGTATLSAYFASTGFTPGGGLAVGFSTPGQTGMSAVQTAFATAGNVNPLGAGVTNPTAGLTVCGTPNLALGAVLIPGANVGTSCATPGTPYSLEIATTFTAGVGQGFNLNGTISNVPEPASVALFGTVLALCASGLRRRRKLS